MLLVTLVRLLYVFNSWELYKFFIKTSEKLTLLPLTFTRRHLPQTNILRKLGAMEKLLLPKHFCQHYYYFPQANFIVCFINIFIDSWCYLFFRDTMYPLTSLAELVLFVQIISKCISMSLHKYHSTS